MMEMKFTCIILSIFRRSIYKEIMKLNEIELEDLPIIHSRH